MFNNIFYFIRNISTPFLPLSLNQFFPPHPPLYKHRHIKSISLISTLFPTKPQPHFVDDARGAADTLQHLVDFLRDYYFPHLAWRKIRLNPPKAKFRSANGKIPQSCAHHRRPSALPLRKLPRPRIGRSLLRRAALKAFLASLLFLNTYIPSRADLSRFPRTAIRTAIMTEAGTGGGEAREAVEDGVVW